MSDRANYGFENRLDYIYGIILLTEPEWARETLHFLRHFGKYFNDEKTGAL